MFFTSDCRQVRELLWDHAKGTLSSNDSDRAESHLARCEACRSELNSYRNTISIMADYKRDSVPVSRLGWRDIQRRVSAQDAVAIPWTKRPLIQFTLGGGSLALATLFVMLVMQANMNPHISLTAQGVPPSLASGAGHDATSEPDSISFRSSAGMLSMIEMPKFEDASVTAIRKVPPQFGRVVFRKLSPGFKPGNSTSTGSQVAANDVNVDGGSPVQPLRPEYVLASASSGNDEDQNRQGVIDVVYSSRASGGSDSAEESHPW